MPAEPIDLDAVEALANAATPGPWIDMGDTDVYAGEVRCAEPYTAVCRDPEMDDRPDDRAFIAAARTLVPEMAAEIRALRARVATLEDKRQHDLADVKWFCDTARGYMNERDDLRAQVVELESANRRLDTALTEEIGRRDDYHKAADRLAYAIAPVEVIGEHSNANDPWENAEEALDMERAALRRETEELRLTLANERGEGEPPVPGWEYRDPFPDLPRVAEVRDFRTWCHESGLFLRRRDDGTGWRIGKGRVVNGPLYRFARDAMRDVFAAGGSDAS